MDLVERVARAIMQNIIADRDDALNAARAAIAAMREPSDAMIDAAWNAISTERITATEAWQAMIDAALAQQEDKS